jgi:hypothetical protein
VKDKLSLFDIIKKLEELRQKYGDYVKTNISDIYIEDQRIERQSYKRRILLLDK